jgi:hypothetical protein
VLHHLPSEGHCIEDDASNLKGVCLTALTAAGNHEWFVESILLFETALALHLVEAFGIVFHRDLSFVDGLMAEGDLVVP